MDPVTDPPSRWTDLEIVDIVTCRGIRPAFVDLNICRADTVEYPPGLVDDVLEEMRIAYKADHAKLGFTPWEAM